MENKQTRNNSGKPKLTYWYFNRDAIHAVEEAGTHIALADSSAPVLLDRISSYLTGNDSDLAAAGYLLMRRVRADVIESNGTLVGEPESDDPDGNDVGIDTAKVEFCHVAETGAATYGNWNFVKGDFVCSYLDSALRHLDLRADGELIDPSSGCLHSAHALWNVMAALGQPTWRDDRACKTYPGANLPKCNDERWTPAPPPPGWLDVRTGTTVPLVIDVDPDLDAEVDVLLQPETRAERYRRLSLNDRR